jgi:hypothetical protein
VFDLTDFNECLVFCIVAFNLHRVGSAFVDSALLRRGMLTECLAQKTKRSLIVPLGSQQEIHGGAGLVDGSVARLGRGYSAGRIAAVGGQTRTAMWDRGEQFKGRHFTAEVIPWAVRWYLQFPISYRDLELMLQDRGVWVDHTTIFRWI